ncbi:SpaA isopeptide-forming pilin-related protein [Enterococcus sp. AZ163]|uniref:SpaA isopeptide-forming pilin-related protein n=3 Tax=Enterococcus TaxID=1350 RepID=UPI003D28B27C
MKKPSFKIIYFFMTIVIILSNLMPLTVIAETLSSDDVVRLNEFKVDALSEGQVNGELKLEVKNDQSSANETILTFDEGVTIDEAVIAPDDGNVVAEMADMPSILSQIQPEATTSSSDGLTESPLQPMEATNITGNQLRLVTKPNVHSSPVLRIKLTVNPTDKKEFSVMTGQQRVTAEIAQSAASEESTSSSQVETSETSSSEATSTEESTTKESTTKESTVKESTTSTSQSTKESETIATTESTSEAPAKRAVAPLREAANIKDLIDQYSPGDRFITNVEADIPNPAKISDPSSLHIDFAIPETVRTQLQIGDYYEVPLPQGLNVSSLIADQNLVDPNDPSIIWGKYTIDPASKTIRIVLTDTSGGTTGTFEPFQTGEIDFSTRFDQQVITKPGNNQIIYPSEYNLPPLTLMIQPTTSTSVSKAGTFDKQVNPEQIIWSVDVNKDLSSLASPTLAETFPANTTYESAQVFPLEVNFNGEVTSVSNTALNPNQYEIDSNGNITFSGTIDQAYRVIYTTRIIDAAKPSEGGNPTFTNNATFNNLPASATVTANYGKRVEKVQDNYSAANQEYTWTIRYNYGQKEIAAGTTVTDTFSNNMDIQAEDVQPYYVSIADNGAISRGMPVSPDAYTVAITPGTPKNTMTVTFNDRVQQNQAINIEYTSKVNTIVSGEKDPVITNSAETGGITTTPNITPPTQQAVIKNQPTVEVGSKIAKWSVDINRNGYQLNNAVFTDKLDQSEKGYVSYPYYQQGGQDVTGIRIFDTTDNQELTGRTLIDGAPQGNVSNPDFEINIVTSNGAGNEGQGDPYSEFTVRFLNNYQTTNHTFSMEYQTKYNQFSGTNPPSPQRLVYNNGIELDWTDENNTSHHSESNNGFETSTQEANKGEKSGSYNPVTKEITWTIVANYNNAQVENFLFNDPITGNQVYIKDSLNITRGTIDDSNGQFVATQTPEYQGEQKDQGYIDFTEPEKYFSGGTITDPAGAANELNISVGDAQQAIPGWNTAGAPRVYQIQFKTTLKGQIIQDQSTYTNIANISIEGVTENLPASISIRYNQETVNKSVNYDADTNEINWGLWINRNQSLLVQPTITDTPSSNQIIDPDSVEIHLGEVAADGTVNETNQTLVKGTDYTVDITTDNTTGQQQMVVAFSENYLEAGQSQKGFIEKPYHLTYSTKPNFTTASEQVSNSVNVSTKEGVIPRPGTETSTQVQISDTSGTAIGQKGSVTIRKTNGQGAVLAGAKLTLTRVFDNPTIAEQPLYELTTDQTGRATFGNLVYTNTNPTNGFHYILKEVEAPDGYTISDELINGIELVVNQDSSASNAVETIENQPVSVTFNKVDAANQALSGGLFSLEKQNADGNYEIYGEPFAADSAGTTLTNLIDGTYRLFEILPPTDTAGNLQYLFNRTRLTFEVSPAANGQRQVLVNGNATDTLTLRNYRGSAELYKQNEASVPVQGANFSVQWAPFNSNDFTDYQPGTIYTTNAQGKLELTDLIPGKYRVKETAAPNGYFVNNRLFNFAINQDGTNGAPAAVQLNTASNPLVDYLGNARFRKVDGSVFAEPGEEKPLAGAVFQLYEADGTTEVGSPVTSGQDGYFIFENLQAGQEYRIREVTPPTGFIRNQTEIRFTMPTSDSSSPTFITNQGEKLVYDETTAFKNYKEHVRFRKLAQDRISEDVTKPLAGAKYSLEVQNNGQWEAVANPEQLGADPEGHFVSAEDGYVRAMELSPGSYRFVEAEAPTGYIRNTKAIAFSVPAGGIGDPGILDIDITGDENTNFKGAAQLVKINEANAPVAGADFEIYTEADQKVADATSNADGEVYVEALAPGNYYFKEVRTNNNDYLVNETQIPFTIAAESSGQPAIVEDNEQGPLSLTNYLGSAELVKYAADGTTVLPNAEFEILDEAGESVQPNTTFATDAAGTVRIDKLAPGNYQFVEVNAPDGYILNTTHVPFTISDAALGQPEVVKTNDAGDLELLNYKGSARMIKQNEAGNPLVGAKFSLEQQTADGWSPVEAYEGEANWMESVEDGSVTAENLSPGTYRFVEEQAPANYLLNTEDLPAFEIVAKNAGEPETVTTFLDESGQSQTLTAANYQGTAQIQKYAEENGSEIVVPGAIFEVIDAEGNSVASGIESQSDGIATAENLAPGTYRFKEVQAAPGYVLNETPSDPFTIADNAQGKPAIVQVGKFINFKGTIQLKKVNADDKALANASFDLWKVANGKETKVTERVSDTEGLIKITALEPGDYELRETKAPAGYIVNTEPIDFTIASKAAEQKVQDLGKFTNYKQEIRLVKQNQAGRPLKDAEFQLQSRQGNQVPDSGKLVSNSQGEVELKDLAPGDYQLVETKAPTGYIRETKPLEFTIKAQQAGQPKVLDLGKWTNYQGQVRLTKVNDDGEKLKGAVFQLLDEKQEISELALDTNAQGEISLESLAPGTYYFKELIAPNGYQKSDQLHKFVIPAKAEGKPKTVETTVTNEKVPAPKTPASPNGTNGTTGSHYPQTNDQNSPILWLVGILIVVSAGVGFWLKRKNMH